MFAFYSLMALAQASQTENAWAISTTLWPKKQKGVLRDSPIIIASKQNKFGLSTGDCVEVICNSDFCQGKRIQEQVLMACDHVQSAELCKDLADEDMIFMEHNQYARLTSMSNDVDVVYQPLSACTRLHEQSTGRQLQQVRQFSLEELSAEREVDFDRFNPQVAQINEQVLPNTENVSFGTLDEFLQTFFPEQTFDLENIRFDFPDINPGGGSALLDDQATTYLPIDVTSQLADMRPDLDTLLATLYIDRIKEDDDPCLAQENCLDEGAAIDGYHTVLRFSTRIYNVGQADVLVGTTPDCPTTQAAAARLDNTLGGLNDEFIFDNCHQHWHYKDYAIYTVTPESVDLPAVEGKKNGFCLMDSGCFRRGAYENYACGTQGITAGCYDEYEYTLGCQWVDITTIYNAVPRNQPNWVVLTLGVNMDQSLAESDYTNNEISARINLNDSRQVRVVSRSLGFAVEDSCFD